MLNQQAINALQEFMNSPEYLITNNPTNASLPLEQQFRASPDYQFRLDQGIEAINRNASARGLLESGSVLRGLTDYAQNTAASEWDDWLNRRMGAYGGYKNLLSSLANPAYTGADQALQQNNLLANYNQIYGNNLAQLLQNTGANIFSGYAQQAGMQNTNLTNAATTQYQLNNQQQLRNDQLMNGIGNLLGNLGNKFF